MELSELREEINQVDAKMLPLFLKRMELGKQIGEVKKALGLSVYNAKREREILSWVTRESGDMDTYARLFFNNMFELF